MKFLFNFSFFSFFFRILFLTLYKEYITIFKNAIYYHLSTIVGIFLDVDKNCNFHEIFPIGIEIIVSINLTTFLLCQGSQ